MSQVEPAALTKVAVTNRLVLGAIILLIEVATLSGGYFLFRSYYDQRKFQFDNLNQAVESIRSKLATLAKDKDSAVAYQKKLSGFKSMLDQHLYWSLFFKFMEKNTMPEIYFTSVAADGGRVTMNGRAKRMGDIGKQVLVLSKFPELITQVSVKNIILIEKDTPTGKTSEMGFNLDLILSPTLIRDSNVLNQ